VTAVHPTGRQVQSLLAACLVAPGEVDEIAARTGVNLDVVGIRAFAGLAEKVKHNGVRAAVQMTFRLLRLTGLEIRLFADYAPMSARRRAALAEFVQTWAADDPARMLVSDLLRHECVLASFRDAPRTPDSRPVSRTVTDRSVLVPYGTSVALDVTCDPEEVVETLLAHDPDIDSVDREPRTILYHRSPGGSTRSFTVPDGVPPLLDALDRSHNLTSLSRALFGSTAALPALRNAYQQLHDWDLVRHDTRGARPCG
jgi:hypothetical protein